MNKKTIDIINKEEKENRIYALTLLYESYNYPTSEDVEIRVSNLKFRENIKCKECILIIGKLLLCVGKQKVYIVHKDPKIRDVWATCTCGRMILARHRYTDYFKKRSAQSIPTSNFNQGT